MTSSNQRHDGPTASGRWRARAAWEALALLASMVVLPAASHAQVRRPVMAVFAHPDDERVIAPLLARLAREGREVHLVIATDGSRGARDYAGIPAGPQLVERRAGEARCAADRLGIRQLHLIGMGDGTLGSSLGILMQLRTRLSTIIERVRPEVVITFGPEGGTGHPDHRLIGNVTTEIVQGGPLNRTTDLYYASLPTERLAAAPTSIPRVSGVAEELLTVRIPLAPQDIVTGRESFHCHWSQYTAAEMAAIDATLVSVWNGNAYLRPWNGPARNPAALRLTRRPRLRRTGG